MRWKRALRALFLLVYVWLAICIPIGLFETPNAIKSRDWAHFATLGLILVLVLICTYFEVRHRRRKRQIEGKCVKCGYDLRASPERCPECGTVPVPARPVGVQ